MKKTLTCLLLAAAVLCFSLCGSAQEETVVMATFYPIYILAENVLEGVQGVRLQSMTPPSTGCLHDYQLLTGDMRALSSAGMLLINGAGMESFLPDVQSAFPALRVVDCSRGVALIAEEAHDGEAEHGEYNAHIWLDPMNAAQMVRNMSEALAELLPDAAEQIRANAERYIARLTNLDSELRAAISELPHKQIVTFHEAFPYFARAYGLEVVAVVALEPDAPLSPKMLSEVIAKVKAAGSPPLFSEPQYENAALKAIAQETGAPVYALDPLVTGDGALTAYEDVMRQNLAVLREALQ